MNTNEIKSGIIWQLRGDYYDDIMNRCPYWADTEDWIFCNMGI